MEKDDKEERLAHLTSLKATTCYCSVCGAKLRYSSFPVHPCFRDAVARLGRYAARAIVRRLQQPPDNAFAPVAPSPDPAHPRVAATKRTREAEETIQRQVKPRLDAPPLAEDGGERHLLALYKARLEREEHSELGILGLLAPLSISSTSPLQSMLVRPVPTVVQHVVISALMSSTAKFIFNLTRHALGINNWDEAPRIDLQRIQLLSQCLLAMESNSNWSTALEEAGVAAILYVPLSGHVLECVNKIRGRSSFAARRNVAALFHQAALALCRHLHAVESLRQPLYDWYESTRITLERGAREAKRLISK